MLNCKTCLTAGLGALLATTAHTSPLEPRQSSTISVVDFSNNTGTPQHLASGTLYGLPNAVGQIPASFFKDIGWKYERAGGAQLPAPARGWIWGVTEYQNRFASVVNNYKTTMNNGGTFIFLIHDLWGADGTQNSSAPYPGDNGDWSSWDQCLTRLFADMKTNKMTTRMVIDIWNEPDGYGFWARTQSQYLDMWGRTYYMLKKTFGSTVLTSGPAIAGEPVPENQWFVNWAAFVAKNGSVPDQYSWHMEGGGGDMLSTYGGLLNVLKTYSLPTNRTININEYAIYSEQVPSGSAWWIAQLERVNAFGLRGNWLSGYALHDYLASMLGKPGANAGSYSPTKAGYWPNGDYQVYKYYNLNMTGHRVGSLPSGDLRLDTYATVGTDGVARCLTGVRPATGTWTVQFNNLQSLGLPASGSLNIHTWGFPVNNDGGVHFEEVDGPTDLGYYSHPYSGGSVSFPVFQNDVTTAYAFTFALNGQTVF